MTLKAFTYEPKHVGWLNFSDESLRLPGTNKVDDPAQADIFIMPASLQHFRGPNIELLKKLPYMANREERHVFFDCSDFDHVYNLKCMFIRCNLKKFMKDADTNSISWPWPVDDFNDIAVPPIEGFKYDVSFHGWNSRWERTASIASVIEHSNLKSDTAVYTDFYGYVHRDNRPEANRRMAAYKNSLWQSRISLCGCSIPGVFPYRFFEAMSASRIPLLICSDYNLPWQNKIDWDKCTIKIESTQAGSAAKIIRDYLDKVTDIELIERGKYGRDMFMEWLYREDWPSLMTRAVEERFTTMGLGSL
mgnify:CR=1 FL=1